MAAGELVEWGEWERALFGTSREAVERVVKKGLTPLLSLRPQSLKAMRATGLMPFVIFISPRSLERLRINRQKNPNTHNLKVRIGRLWELESEGGWLDRTRS